MLGLSFTQVSVNYNFGRRPQNRIPITGKGAHDGVGDVMDAFSAPANKNEAPAKMAGASDLGKIAFASALG